VIVFTPTITSRLQYVADFIGKEIIGQPLQLSENISEYKNTNGPRINYSNEKITKDECWIQPHSLLFEKGIKEQMVDCFQWEGTKAFFKTEGEFPFDIFAACFYLLSRYEEYLPHQKDIYGRYAHTNALAFKEGFLDLPLVNIWLKFFKEELIKKFPDFKSQLVSSAGYSGSSMRFLPTYDIDEAYAYKYKSRWRTTGALVKSLLKGNWSGFRERRKVLKGKLRDPYDAYEWMDQLHQQHRLQPRYFFLVAGKTGKYDRNILPHEVAMKELIRQHARKYAIGIHPSWQSGDNELLLKKEITTLESITGKKITSSRQHFIRFTLPATCRRLVEEGFEEDFSMGYGSINGFRASVASPFYWYDLEKEQTTGLTQYPFCFMEANSFFEQKLSPEQGLEEIRRYYKTVQDVNGMFICIWHNTFLGTASYYKGWREVYEEFLKNR
jgi:hypothetical protein